eukprot:CAMPEP_0172494578 /NCGR_PEP_ID=MMETSP1066-20121228/51230_1 /TAXON_ID=671091 /ORGANISM="Coscinodiscus wailesii, Strain CCMP2513" /LENGTH=112 /DNA_ID=CAMNT_0013265663 /DNA_START=277 /DNA_END=615 /DNA_ORIENTATION=-
MTRELSYTRTCQRIDFIALPVLTRHGNHTTARNDGGIPPYEIVPRKLISEDAAHDCGMISETNKNFSNFSNSHTHSNINGNIIDNVHDDVCTHGRRFGGGDLVGEIGVQSCE